MVATLARSFIPYIVLLPAMILAGCQPAAAPVTRPAPAPAAIDYTHPLPPGQMALRKISPEQYPDFSRALAGANVAELRASAENSLAYMARPGSRKGYPYLDIDHERAIASLQAFVRLIDSGAFAGPADEFNRKIAEQFDVYQSIGAPAPDGSAYTGKVLFTGYYTPTYDASLTRGGPYQWPLYKRPGDLVYDPASDNAGRRMPDGSLAPYATRQEVESGAMAGNELVWLTGRWNAYVITIQGSGRLRLPDGRIMEVGYAGNNGRPYVSPGMKMVADGVIAKSDLSFETMRRYFAANPAAMDVYLWQNPRTVFFTEVHGGPFGSLNVPVTRLASIATDKDVYPRAMPAFVSAPANSDSASSPGPTSDINQFVLDQDRGGAIRSAGRCDIYMGIGDRAEQTAGHQLSAGTLYYFAVKGAVR